MDVSNLNLGGSLTILPVSDTQEEHSSGDTGDIEGARHGSGDLNLSDYLVARMESESSIPENATPSSDDSFIDCSLVENIQLVSP